MTSSSLNFDVITIHLFYNNSLLETELDMKSVNKNSCINLSWNITYWRSRFTSSKLIPCQKIESFIININLSAFILNFLSAGVLPSLPYQSTIWRIRPLDLQTQPCLRHHDLSTFLFHIHPAFLISYLIGATWRHFMQSRIKENPMTWILKW